MKALLVGAATLLAARINRMLEDHDETELRQYLLGTLPDQARDLIEQRIMSDETFLGRVEAAEDDLVDEYVSGSLSNGEREQFKQIFLAAPERGAKLEFALALRKHIERVRSASSETANFTFFTTRSFVFRALAVATLLLVAAGSIWIYFQNRQSQEFATATLTITNASRGDAGVVTRIKLPANAAGVTLALKLPAEARSANAYSAQLLDAHGSQPAPVVERSVDAVTVVVKREQLSTGEYAIKLSAINADGSEQPLVGSYLFIVE